MRTTVNLPDPLLENARQFASRQGMTLSELLEDALRCRMAQRGSKAVGRFQLHTVRGARLNPGLDLDRTSALIAADDEDQFRRGR
jgi:hypothetical protein